MADTRDGALTRYFYGASYFGRGLKFVVDHGGLWPWVIAPTVLVAAITVGGVWWAQRFADAFVEAHAAGHWFAFLFRFFLWLFVIAVGLVSYLAASFIASAPFAGPLSARVERLRTGQPAPKEGLAATMASFAHVAVAAVVYLALSALIFFLQLTLSVLSPFLGVLGFFVTAKYLAYNNLDYALTRRELGFGEKWAWINRHRAETYGFGSAIALLAFVPGLGLLVPPLAAVGATLLYLDLESGVRP
jgi:CysZ protein